jgi:hypothetical protein
MNNKTFVCMIFCLAVFCLGCTKNGSVSEKWKLSEQGSVLLRSSGANQFDGIGYFDATDGCNSQGQGAAYAVNMTGELEGCLYTFIDEFECSPSGTYREIGREHFVGMYKGQSGSFWTEYKFEAKYEGCAVNGSALGLEILGRCQHPIVNGSGEGVFEGVTGRLDMKDDIEAGNYPFRGHFQWVK